jgi:hypothetical protein
MKSSSACLVDEIRTCVPYQIAFRSLQASCFDKKDSSFDIHCDTEPEITSSERQDENICKMSSCSVMKPKNHDLNGTEGIRLERSKKLVGIVFYLFSSWLMLSYFPVSFY